MDLRAVGKEIKKYRELNNLTQEELSEKIGLTRNYISLLERGTKTPRLETLIKIANALKISANTLLQDYLEYDDMVKDTHISYEVNGLSPRDKALIIGMINVLKNINEQYAEE